MVESVNQVEMLYTFDKCFKDSLTAACSVVLVLPKKL